MTRKILYLAALLISSIAANAPAQIKIRPIRVPTQIKLPTASEAAKVLTRQNIRIAPLDDSEKLESINESLQEKNLPKATGTTPSVRLSAANPILSDENRLGYFKPWNVLVNGNSVQFSEAKYFGDSSLYVGFKPPAAGNYFLDLSVAKYSGTKFTVFTMDGKNLITQNYPQAPDKYTHITFVLNFADTSSQGITILADQGWEFFDCEISRIN